ncbi:MAG: YbjN domain-containing protein [Nitriliruptoraceae bacterium]|nr:YbjN domain-containing protein [Nitriliruptoraceae bacterium]
MSTVLTDAVAAAFTRRGLEVESEASGDDTHLIGHAVEDASWVVVGVVNESEGRAQVYSVLPIDLPEDTFPAITELLARINFGMLGPCFELDVSDGECRCRTSLDLGGPADGAFDTAQLDRIVESMVGLNGQAMDTYLDAILDVARGATTPADAVAAVEDED